MPRCTFRSASLLVGLGVGMVAACGTDTEPRPRPLQRESAITDGTEDSGHPEVGRLLIDVSGTTAQDTCTAFLIGPQAVLTAAHCLDNSVTNLFQLDGKVHDVTKVIPHGSWDKAVSPYKHDIGLVLLKSPLGVATPAYGTLAPTAGMAVLLVGVGRTAETAQDSGTKRVASNTVENVGTGYFTITGTGSGAGNICLGDSGGPVYDKASGAALGVISAEESPLCTGARSYHVAIKDYLSWIGSQLSPGDTTAPTVTINGPADGATVATSVMLDVSATDDVGVVSVEAQVDGASVSTLTQAPYQFALTLSPGAHTLEAVARDAAGHSGSAQVSVTAVSGPLPDGAATADGGSDALGGDADPDRPRGQDGCAVSGQGAPPWPSVLLLVILLVRRRRLS